MYRKEAYLETSTGRIPLDATRTFETVLSRFPNHKIVFESVETRKGKTTSKLAIRRGNLTVAALSLIAYSY